MAQNLAPRVFTRKTAVMALLLVFLTTAGHVAAQEKVAVTGLQKDSSKDTWHVLKTVGDVTVSYHYLDCGPTEYVQFRINNASAVKMNVSWVYKQSNNGTQIDLIPDLAKVNYTVDANGSVEGGCNSEHFKLGVFVRESGLVLKLTDIELTELTITAAQ